MYLKTGSKERNLTALLKMCNRTIRHRENNHPYDRRQKDALILKFILVKELYIFRRDLLSIIRSLNIVFTSIGIYHTSCVDCLLADSQLLMMDSKYVRNM
jgi:hypothetical protein